MTSALVTDTEWVGFVLNDDRLRRGSSIHHGKNAKPLRGKHANGHKLNARPGEVRFWHLADIAVKRRLGPLLGLGQTDS